MAADIGIKSIIRQTVKPPSGAPTSSIVDTLQNYPIAGNSCCRKAGHSAMHMIERLLPLAERNLINTRVNSPGQSHSDVPLGTGKNTIDWTIRSQVLTPLKSTQKIARSTMRLTSPSICERIMRVSMEQVQRPNGSWYDQIRSCLSYGPSLQKCRIYCRDAYSSRDRSIDICQLESRTARNRAVSHKNKKEYMRCMYSLKNKLEITFIFCIHNHNGLN